MIHDAVFDHYGKRLATSSGDGTVLIQEIIGEQINVVSKLPSPNKTAILSLAWSHPKFGSVLASGGRDQNVIIWREMSLNHW